jgi:hypothetical protein
LKLHDQPVWIVIICLAPFNAELQSDVKLEHANNLQTPVIGQILRGGFNGNTVGSISGTNNNTLTWLVQNN